MVYGETGRFPLKINIKTKLLCFWSRLVQSSSNKLSGILYQLMYNLHNSGQYSFKWLSSVKQILDDTGFSFVWNAQGDIKSSDIKKEIKQRLVDQFGQSLSADMTNSSRGVFYASYKTMFCLEPYLLNLKVADRYIYSKFRCSNIKIPIEVGRWKNTPRENRICCHCDSNTIGDEYHYFFVCSNKQIMSLRERYIPTYYIKNPSQLKFIGLLSL